MNKKILITGANGLVGQNLSELFQPTGYEVALLDLQKQNRLESHSNFEYISSDITNYPQLKEIIGSFKPHTIINCAAYTNVDGCETEKELSWKVNVTGPEYLADLAKRYDSHLIHISSDYVFDGKNGPYTEEDPPNPCSVYGEEKLESEKIIQATECRHTIIRGIVIFGYGTDIPLNFTSWLTREMKAGNKVNIVTDQWGNSLFAPDMAKGIFDIFKSGIPGVYHLGNEHFHSRYDFAIEFANFFGYSSELIEPILTVALKQKAERPLKSGLVSEKARSDFGFNTVPLEESFRRIREYR